MYSALWTGFFACSFMFGSLLANDANTVFQSNGNGNAINVEVVVSGERVSLQATIFLGDGSIADVSPISSLDRDVITLPVVSVNQSADIVVVWQSFNPATNMICIEGAAYTQSLGWSEPNIITSDSDFVEAGNYRVQLNENGLFILFWSRIVPPKLNGVQATTILKISDFFD